MATPSEAVVPPNQAGMDWNSLALGGIGKIKAYNPPVKKDAYITSIVNTKAEVDVRDVVNPANVEHDYIGLFIPESEKLEMTISKEELDAKLGRNKAEVDAIASGMKTEMANFRTSYMDSFSKISDALTRIEARADATEKRLTQAQWIVSLVISICAVTLSAVIFFSNKNSNKPIQQPSVVVNTIQPSNNTPPLNQK